MTKALACHDTAVDYLKLLKGKVCEKQAPYSVQKHDKAKNVIKDLITRFKVANFVKQKKRIASSAKQAASKASESS